MKVAKNKVAPPFRIAEFDILFGRGISTLGCLLDLAEETGVVVRKGAWYSYEGDNIGQGRDNTITWLENSKPRSLWSSWCVKLAEGSEVRRIPCVRSLRQLAQLRIARQLQRMLRLQLNGQVDCQSGSAVVIVLLPDLFPCPWLRRLLIR